MAVTLDIKFVRFRMGLSWPWDEWDQSPVKLIQDLPAHLLTDVLRK